MADEQHKMSSLVLPALKLSGMSLGLFYFICLILIDNWSALKSKPRTWWIPGKALILSALSIQVLSYLDYSNIRFSDAPTPDEVAKLLGNQLVIDSGRLVICVFIGYLLPGMATRGSAQASSDIVALVVSLFTAIISELFFVHKAAHEYEKVDYNYVYVFFTEWKSNPKIKVWFIVSSSIFLMAIVMLILFLVSAIIAGKTVRCMMKQRINSVISLNKGKECWEKFDDELLKQWLLCRAAQPQYVIARSVLSSSTGLVVTISIVLFMAKTLKLGSSIINFDDGLDWLRHTTFGLQCLFVVLGGWVIFHRWFRAVINFPVFFKVKEGIHSSLPNWTRFSVEDFWTRSILELINMYDLHQWRRDQKPAVDRTGIFMKVLTRLKLHKAADTTGIFMKVFTRLKLHKLLYSVWALQKSLVWFSKFCWFLSEMFFCSMLMRRTILRKDTSMFDDSVREEEDNEFGKYQKALKHVCMPGEHPASLWLNNKDSIKQASDRIKEGRDLGNCENFIKLIQKRHNEEKFVLKPDEDLPLVKLVKEYFPTLNEIWWKITAVSLLRIIIKLEEDGKKKEAIDGYKQAWDLMSFVESSNTEQPNSIDWTQVFDIEADFVSMAADNEFKILEKTLKSSHEDVNAARAIELELDKAEREAQKLLSTREGGETPQGMQNAVFQRPNDSRDWNKFVPCYNMYRVCKKLQSHNGHGVVNLEELYMCLGDVIADCVEQLPSIIISSFGVWTVEHQDDKMWEAFHVAGKCKQVVQDCGLEPNWKISEQTN